MEDFCHALESEQRRYQLLPFQHSKMMPGSLELLSVAKSFGQLPFLNLSAQYEQPSPRQTHFNRAVAMQPIWFRQREQSLLPFHQQCRAYGRHLAMEQAMKQLAGPIHSSGFVHCFDSGLEQNPQNLADFHTCSAVQSTFLTAPYAIQVESGKKHLVSPSAGKMTCTGDAEEDHETLPPCDSSCANKMMLLSTGHSKHFDTRHGKVISAIPHASKMTRERDAEEDSEKQPRVESNGANEKFPMKLYRMLEEAEQNGDDGIVSFLPSGNAFVIHKPTEFAEKIMPKYCHSTRMSSFQRQLNFYGFRRIADINGQVGYFHASFVKGQKELCNKIRRRKPIAKVRARATTAHNPALGDLLYRAVTRGIHGTQALERQELSVFLREVSCVGR